jgi:hypothetical protein
MREISIATRPLQNKLSFVIVCSVSTTLRTLGSAGSALSHDF